MALPRGIQHAAPRSRLQRLLLWLGFAGLLARIAGIGIRQWIGQGWYTRKPGISRAAEAGTRSRAV